MKNKLIVTEIDLLKVILNIWQNKFKIIIITILTFFLFFGYFVINKKHVSVTKINPIAIINEDNYNYYNTQIELLDRKLGFQDSILGKKYINQLRIINRNYLDNHNKKINNTYVINLFYDEINNKKNLIHAINKFQSINKKNEKNDLYSRFIKNLSPFIEFNNQSIEYKYSNFQNQMKLKYKKFLNT
jgi:LPS O-antigen subunit length determinant protein (WzzB/FepE family)